MFGNSLNTIKAIFTDPSIRDRTVFSLSVIVIYRALAAVPVIGIDADSLSELFAQLGGIGDAISTVSGGVLETASVIAIGLGPYINASIILQLLGTVIPKLEELRKEGSQGRRVISMYTRYLTVPFAILQSFVIYGTLRGFGLLDEITTLELATMVGTLTGGSMLLMWIGESYTERGFGNGSSFIIFLGIVAGLPSIISNNLRTADALEIAVFGAILVLMTAAVIYVTQAEKRVKVMYSRRVRQYGNQDNHIPIKLTQFGVLPVIFAVSLISFPQLMAQFIISRDFNSGLTEMANTVIQYTADPNIQNLMTFIFVVLFSFFYVTVISKSK